MVVLITIEDITFCLFVLNVYIDIGPAIDFDFECVSWMVACWSVPVQPCVPLARQLALRQANGPSCSPSNVHSVRLLCDPRRHTGKSYRPPSGISEIRNIKIVLYMFFLGHSLSRAYLIKGQYDVCNEERNNADEHARNNVEIDVFAVTQ